MIEKRSLTNKKESSTEKITSRTLAAVAYASFSASGTEKIAICVRLVTTATRLLEAELNKESLLEEYELFERRNEYCSAKSMMRISLINNFNSV